MAYRLGNFNERTRVAYSLGTVNKRTGGGSPLLNNKRTVGTVNRMTISGLLALKCQKRTVGCLPPWKCQ